MIFDNASGKRCFADGSRRSYVLSEESRRKFNENHELGSPNVPGAWGGAVTDSTKNSGKAALRGHTRVNGVFAGTSSQRRIVVVAPSLIVLVTSEARIPSITQIVPFHRT